jgi:hypothetical protein
MRRLLTVTITGLAAAPLAPAMAADMNVKVEIPRLNVAEYHRPYVSMWIERADQSPVTTLAVWYDAKNKEGQGTKWLKDMRQWWRKAGRDMQMPADGVSGATRAPGEHALTFSDGKAPLGKLPPATTSSWWKPRAKWADANSCACRSRGRQGRAARAPRASTSSAAYLST